MGSPPLQPGSPLCGPSEAMGDLRAVQLRAGTHRWLVGRCNVFKVISTEVLTFVRLYIE